MADKRIRVVFLTFYYEAWDSLAEIYGLMLKDSRFEVSVVAIGRKLTGDGGFSDGSETAEFFERQQIPHVLNADLKDLRPDYIFVNYPWQRNYSPQYRPDALAKIGRVVYVPYFSLPLVQEPVDGVNPESGFEPIAAHLYTQRMHQVSALVFTQDEFTREAFAGTQRGNAHVHFVGSTKLDALIEELNALADGAAEGSESKSKSKGQTLVWAPHHSYSPHWLNFGTFARVRNQMLEWAANHPQIHVVMRPHPFLYGTMIDRQVMTQAELDDWLTAWSALPNTSVDSESSSAEIFAKADYILSDGISYLAEWPLAVGKSAIFLENTGHWDFTPLGELAAATAEIISAIDELDGAIRAIDGGLDRAAEIKALRSGAMPNSGHTAGAIVEVVAADAEAGTGLVDVAEITEIPWELQSNREPMD